MKYTTFLYDLTENKDVSGKKKIHKEPQTNIWSNLLAFRDLGVVVAGSRGGV